MRYLHGSINQKVPVKVAFREGLFAWKYKEESSRKSGLQWSLVRGLFTWKHEVKVPAKVVLEEERGGLLTVISPLEVLLYYSIYIQGK